MKLIENQNIWDYWNRARYFCFTGNSFCTVKHEVVMGRGLAREVRDRFKFIPNVFFQSIPGHLSTYGFVTLPGTRSMEIEEDTHYCTICAFQVKRHYMDPAIPSLIGYSTEMMRKYALDSPNEIFLLNFPGIGNGKLHKSMVLPIIRSLPDNVWVFSLG